MSFKSFLQNAIKSITDFISKILPTSKHLLDIALVVVNGIKLFTDSGVADIAAQLVGGNAGEAILTKVRQVLPTIFTDLKLADAEAGKTGDEVLKDGITAIQSMPTKAQSTTLQSVWQLLSDALTEDGVTLSDLQKIGQSFYEESKVLTA